MACVYLLSNKGIEKDISFSVNQMSVEWGVLNIRNWSMINLCHTICMC